MVCPKCNIEARVTERKEDGTVTLACRNPQCEDCGKVVGEVK